MHAAPGSRRRESGFTMIEVMIAVLLAAIAVMGIIALFVGQSRAAGRSRRQGEAAILANDKLEKLRTLATASVITGSDSLPIDVQGATGEIGSIYTRKWDITNVGGVTKMVVKVGWDEDEVKATTCSSDANCTSGYCNVSTCLSYAVQVYGMRL